MALKDTCKKMKDCLDCIQADLTKAEEGNKAAAQRVRTCSIKFEKAAKVYRKESVKAEKTGTGGKKKPSAKKAAPKKGKAKATPPKKAAAKPVAPKKPVKAKKAAKPKPLARKKPTAKLLKTPRKRK